MQILARSLKRDVAIIGSAFLVDIQRIVAEPGQDVKTLSANAAELSDSKGSGPLAQLAEQLTFNPFEL